MSQPITIGLLGAANILPRAMLAPAKLLATPCQFAVAARDPAKAIAFAQQHDIAQVYQDYAALLASDQVHGVYIPLPNRLHVSWAIKALQAGKPVLIEKPLCLRSSEFAELAAVAQATEVPVMEALMPGFHPWQAALRAIIHSERFGRLQTTKTQLFTNLTDTPRSNYRFSPELGGGAFFDLGIYWLQFIQQCLAQTPIAMQAHAEFCPIYRVDLEFSAQLQFDNGVTSTFEASFTRPFTADHWLEFSDATLKLRNFFRPAFGAQTLWFDVQYKTGAKEKISFPAQNYYANQLATFMQVIQGASAPESLPQLGARVNLMESLYAMVKP